MCLEFGIEKCGVQWVLRSPVDSSGHLQSVSVPCCFASGMSKPKGGEKKWLGQHSGASKPSRAPPAISHPLRKGGKFPHFRDFVSPAVGPPATSMSSQDSCVTDPSAQAAVSPWPQRVFSSIKVESFSIPQEWRPAVD